jgi:hypothetical protein
MPCESLAARVRRHQAMIDPATILADCEQVRAHATPGARPLRTITPASPEVAALR